MPNFYVRACWDAESQVFFSETDIPGLTVEAPSLAEFQQLIFDLAPEMLAENAGLHGDVRIRFTAERDLALAVA